MFDLAVKNGRVVGEPDVVEAHLYVKDGKFAGISSEDLPAREEFDAGGAIVFPGGVDPHVHFNDPGYTAGEDFHTGSMSAADQNRCCRIEPSAVTCMTCAGGMRKTSR